MWRLSEAQRWSPSPRMRTLTVEYRHRRGALMSTLHVGWQGRRSRFRPVECNFLSAPIVTVPNAGPIRKRANWRGRAIFRVEAGREIVVGGGTWFVMPDRDCSYVDIKREIRFATISLRFPDGLALIGAPRLGAPLRSLLRTWCRFRLWRGVCPRPDAARPVGINGVDLSVSDGRCGQCIVCLEDHLVACWLKDYRREDPHRVRSAARSDVAFLYAEGMLNLVRLDKPYNTQAAFHARPLSVDCREMLLASSTDGLPARDEHAAFVRSLSDDRDLATT